MTDQVPGKGLNGKTNSAPERLARSLGWLSLGIGVAEVAAPRRVSRLSGVDDSATAPAAVRLAGMRELGHAAGLLSRRRPARWAWSRVAGDAMDLAALGRATAVRRGERRRRSAIATAAVAGITALDVLAAVWAASNRPVTGRTKRSAGPLRATASITVKKPADEVYRYWRDFANLPAFMYHVESVRVDDDRRSHWTAKAPMGRTVEWDAEIVEDVAGQRIAWRSTGEAEVPNSGTVQFAPAPGGRGTEVRVRLEYSPPGGALATAFAKLFGEHPEQQVRDDLRRFKQVLETGEVVRSEGSPEGTRTGRLLKQRPAEPVSERVSTATG